MTKVSFRRRRRRRRRGNLSRQAQTTKTTGGSLLSLSSGCVSLKRASDSGSRACLHSKLARIGSTRSTQTGANILRNSPTKTLISRADLARKSSASELASPLPAASKEHSSRWPTKERHIISGPSEFANWPANATRARAPAPKSSPSQR